MIELSFEDKRRLFASKAGKAYTTGRPRTAAWGRNFLWLHVLKVDGYVKSLCALNCFDEKGKRNYANTNYLDYQSTEFFIHAFVQTEIVPRFSVEFIASNGPLQFGFPNSEALTEFRVLLREIIFPSQVGQVSEGAERNLRLRPVWSDQERLAFSYLKDALMSRTDKFDPRIVVLSSQLDHLFYTDLNPSMQQNLLAWDYSIRGEKITACELQEFRTLKPPAQLDKPMWELACEIRHRTNAATAGGCVSPSPEFLGAIGSQKTKLQALIEQACDRSLLIYQHWVSVLGRFPVERTAKGRFQALRNAQLQFLEKRGKYAKSKSIPDDAAHALDRLKSRISRKVSQDLERLSREPHAVLEAFEAGHMVELRYAIAIARMKDTFRAMSEKFNNNQLNLTFTCPIADWRAFSLRVGDDLQLHSLDMHFPELSSDKNVVRVIAALQGASDVTVFLQVQSACPRLADKLRKGDFHKDPMLGRYRWVLSTYCQNQRQFADDARSRARHARQWAKALQVHEGTKPC